MHRMRAHHRRVPANDHRSRGACPYQQVRSARTKELMLSDKTGRWPFSADPASLRAHCI